MKTEQSLYLASIRPALKETLAALLKTYPYASVLATDVEAKDYALSMRGTNIAENNRFGKRGYVFRIYEGNGYLEYSGTTVSENLTKEVTDAFSSMIKNRTKYETLPTPMDKDPELRLSESTEYEIDPRALGDEKIIEKLSAVRTMALKKDERIIDCNVHFSFQVYHKIFLSREKDLEQNVMWSSVALAVMARRNEEIKDNYKASSVLGGAEILDRMEPFVDQAVTTVIDLLKAEPLKPGTYECVCTPEVTGMIVHEAFGHGVEMDMFVKDRALAKSYIGKQVASELITMRDGAATGYEDVATYFFDDEGNVSTDTVIIDKGILVNGIADGVSASRLTVNPTGNGRREAVDHKVYTRMTNTYFMEGHDKVEDMIASVKDGLLLESPSSGMEDPKNWGIQCMVSFAREIKDGKLTGRIFSPIVLTGYVPDLLKSITMVSDKVEHSGSGYCGKGWKEWVKVSDGGPYIKATIRLG